MTPSNLEAPRVHKLRLVKAGAVCDWCLGRGCGDCGGGKRKPRRSWKSRRAAQARARLTMKIPDDERARILRYARLEIETDDQATKPRRFRISGNV